MNLQIVVTKKFAIPLNITRLMCEFLPLHFVHLFPCAGGARGPKDVKNEAAP